MGIGNPELIKKAKYRREQILQHVDKPGGITGMKLAEMYGVTKGTILKDIAELRRQGYPIQVSSHIEEGGIIVAVYEIPQMLRRSTKDISAASVEQLSKNASTGAQYAKRPAKEYARTVATDVSIMSAGPEYGAVTTSHRSSAEQKRGNGSATERT